MLNGDERGEGGGAEGSTKGKNEINDKRDAGLTNKQINTWEGPIGKWDNCATRGPSGLFLSLSPFLSLSLFLSFLCFFFALSVPVESGCIVSTSIHPTVSLSLSLSLFVHLFRMSFTSHEAIGRGVLPMDGTHRWIDLSIPTVCFGVPLAPTLSSALYPLLSSFVPRRHRDYRWAPTATGFFQYFVSLFAIRLFVSLFMKSWRRGQPSFFNRSRAFFPL